MVPHLSTSSGILSGAVERKAPEKALTLTTVKADRLFMRELVGIEGCESQTNRNVPCVGVWWKVR